MVSGRAPQVAYVAAAVAQACSLTPDGISQGLVRSDLGELDQHGKVDAGDHFDAFTLHHRNRQIGRRSPEHIGQQYDAVPGVAPIDAGLDLGPPVVHVVVGSDAHRVDV